MPTTAYQRPTLRATSAAATTASIAGLLPEHKAHTPHRVNEPGRVALIDLAAQVGNVDIDYIIQRRDAVGFAPDIASQHFARDHLARLTPQGGQQVKLAGRQFNRLSFARH